MSMRTAWAKNSLSNRPSLTNFTRFNDARLHAVSSRNMYSEHGFDALIRSLFGQVCQELIVVSNCMPGSPQSQVSSAIWRRMAAGLTHLTGLRVDLAKRGQLSLSPCSASCMNSSVTRTELLAF